MTTENLNSLVSDGFIPAACRILWRDPGKEQAPLPRNDECVLFSSPLERGLSPLLHPFLGRLLTLYGIQLHHITPDCITYFSCYIALCEGYHNIPPHLGLWCSLFFLIRKIVGEADADWQCGIVRVVPWRSGYLDLGLLGCAVGWECMFFYFPELSRILGGPRLPQFQLGLPLSRRNWNLRRYGDPEALGYSG